MCLDELLHTQTHLCTYEVVCIGPRSNDALLSQIAASAVEGTRLRAALVAQAQAVLGMHALVGAALPPIGLQALMRHLTLAKVSLLRIWRISIGITFHLSSR